MAKKKIEFEQFADAAGEAHCGFITALHRFMLDHDCRYEIKEAKAGYVLSYIFEPADRTVLNYVFRKNGPMIRIYGDHAASYMQRFAEWPAEMKASVKKVRDCKRLLDPNACLSTCRMGFTFVLDGDEMRKCRNNCFMFYLSEDNNSFLREMVEQEMKYRQLKK